jgi:hypothetical protein
VVNLRQTQNMELKLSAAADPDDPDQETRDGIAPMTMKFRVSVSMDLLDDAVMDGSGAETRPAVEKSEKR